jgi:hypothetical protein
MKKLVAAVCLLSTFAFAQIPAKKEPVPTPKSLIFDDGEILEGTTSGPDLTPIVITPPPRHSSILKIRDNFKDKVMGSAAEL